MFDIAQALSVILIFSTVIQFCVDLVKEIVGPKVMAHLRAPVWALAFGVLFAFLFQLDFFAIFGLTAVLPPAARLVTGLILSAGSAPIHELVAKLRQSRMSDELFSVPPLTDDINTSLGQLTASKIYEKSDESDATV